MSLQNVGGGAKMHIIYELFKSLGVQELNQGRQKAHPSK